MIVLRKMRETIFPLFNQDLLQLTLAMLSVTNAMGKTR